LQIFSIFPSFIFSNPNLPEPQTSLQGGRVKNRFIGLEWPVFIPPEQKYLHIGNEISNDNGKYKLKGYTKFEFEFEFEDYH
jgi:hypothetical protein